MVCAWTLFIITMVSWYFNAAEVNFPINSTQNQNDRIQENAVLDVAIFLDEISEFKYLKKENAPGAISQKLGQAIIQGIPFIATVNLLPILNKYLGQTSNAFDDLLTDKWSMYKSKDAGTFLIGLPKARWMNLQINENTLRLIGLDSENLTALNAQDIVSMANLSNDDQVRGLKIDNEVLKELEGIFLDGAPVKKNIYLNGHGDSKSVAQLNYNLYQQFLTFLNGQNVQLLYVSSCYSGGASLVNAYQKTILEYTQPVNLNYFLFIGSLTDAESLLAPVNFISFFDLIHKFFSPAGITLDKPLESIANAMWGKEFLNVPSIRFPGDINYFKALKVDNSIEIITYSKARAVELEQQIAVQRNLINPKNAINIDENRNIILLYPPVVNTTINMTGSEKRRIISMVPGNAVHYIDTLVNMDFDNLDDVDKLFRWIKSTHFEAKKFFFINNAITKNERGSVAILADGPCLKMIHLNKKKAKYSVEAVGKERCTNVSQRRISGQLANIEIRNSIKKISPWNQLIGDTRPEELIEAALKSI